MYCENCGALIPDDAKFCPECGQMQVPAAKAEPVIPHCPYCGTEIEADSIFCENCGRKLSGEPDQTAERVSIPGSSRASYTPPASSAVSEQPHSSYIPPAPTAAKENSRPSYIPPAPPAAPRGNAVPSASQTETRKTVQTKETKPKKKGSCAVVIIILLLVLLALAAAYYFVRVYEGETPLDRMFPGMKPTAQSLLSTAETVLTKVPETISGITAKPTERSGQVLIQPTEAVSQVIVQPTEIVSQLIIQPTDTAAPVIIQPTATLIPTTLPTATAARSLWDTVKTAPAEESNGAISLVNAPTSVPKATAVPEVRRSYDPGQYSTTEMSRLQDFLWVTQDIVHGTFPAGIDRLTGFDEVLGGWKAWIIDDLNGQYGSGMERLCSVNFAKDANGNGMTFNWVYVHNTQTDEGYTDYTPPTTFYGEMQNGRFYGLGTGSIDMKDFYVLNGHEYAVGTLNWPDASKGTVFLVRP